MKSHSLEGKFPYKSPTIKLYNIKLESCIATTSNPPSEFIFNSGNSIEMEDWTTGSSNTEFFDDNNN